MWKISFFCFIGFLIFFFLFFIYFYFLLENFELFSFGRNQDGELGIGNFENQFIPQKIKIDKNEKILKIFTSSISKYSFIQTKSKINFKSKIKR